MIYLSELSHRINRSGLGLNLTPEEIVAYLKFADDIFLIADAEDALEELKIILEGWCFDFRMKISQKKTQVITPNSTPDWSIMDPTNGNLLELQQVQEYSYLGVMQKITLKLTTEAKNASMLASAKAFQGTLFRLKSTLPDQVATYRAMWENIALPSFLYGADVIPIDPTTVEALDKIQRFVARTLLGVPKSSINEVAVLEMGFKPMILRILTAKVKFYLKVKEGRSACKMTKTCLDLLLGMGNSTYLNNLNSLLAQYNLTHDTLTGSSLSDIEAQIINNVTMSVQLKSSLNLLPIPTKFWKMSAHVEEGLWSKMFSRFRCMNAGLGNRDTHYKSYAVHIEDGRISDCPLCITGPNNEVHLLTGCTVMNRHRAQIMVGDRPLKVTLDTIYTEYRPPSLQELARLFLGQQAGLTKQDYIHRGNALINLVDSFFDEWSARIGREIDRRE